MQERVERWLTFWVAKPISWTLFGIWVAMKYTWAGGVRCASKAREKWTTWRTKSGINGTPVVSTEPSIPVPSKRASKRQMA